MIQTPLLSSTVLEVPKFCLSDVLCSWDDHDIFDGWGSYPDYLQKSAVFQVRAWLGGADEHQQ